MFNDAKPSVDNYIAKFSPEKQAKLTELRACIAAVLPDAKQTLKWNEPAFVHQDGMILVMFGGYANHMNIVVTPSTLQALSSDLQGYTLGKGTVRLVYDDPLPGDLIRKIVEYRAHEYDEQGVTWR